MATYGQIAAMAGSPRAARQVVRALHTSSRSHSLPWHRVINSKGEVALPAGRGFEEQSQLLRDEGVEVTTNGQIDLKRYQWRPRRIPI